MLQNSVVVKCDGSLGSTIMYVMVVTIGTTASSVLVELPAVKEAVVGIGGMIGVSPCD